MINTDLYNRIKTSMEGRKHNHALMILLRNKDASEYIRVGEELRKIGFDFEVTENQITFYNWQLTHSA